VSLFIVNSCLDKDVPTVGKLACYVNTLDGEQIALFIKKITLEQGQRMLELL